MYNFAAGPAMMHPQVKQRLSQMLLDWQDSGMGITEVPHRSTLFRDFLRKVQNKVLATLGLTDDFEVLLLSGTTREHFSLIAQQFLNTQALYVQTGHWSKWAANSALRYGSVQSCTLENCQSLGRNFDYAYACLNETIEGIQYVELPRLGLPWFVDATSEIFSRPIDFECIDLMLAGAQKNAGIAGLVIVIVRKSRLLQARVTDPSFSYLEQYRAHNLYATPPALAIAALDATLDWIAQNGGIQAMHRQAKERSALIYAGIDQSQGFYRNGVAPELRSVMNVPFSLAKAHLTELFLKQAQERGLCNLKGHRSLGGIRASMYNAMPMQAAQDLADFMDAFFREHNDS